MYCNIETTVKLYILCVFQGPGSGSVCTGPGVAVQRLAVEWKPGWNIFSKYVTVLTHCSLFLLYGLKI